MFCPACRADYPADYKVCPKDATHLLASPRIGKYQIDALIGVGGMGAVYRAINPDTKARVAIKLMNPAVAGSEPARARFQREAAAVAALRTTHVVKVYDFGTEADGTLYLVMELLDGHSLRDEIFPAPARMELARVQMVMDGALKGLAAAHRAGIVHRDLKPDNVFVADTDDGEVPKLLDFGIARVATKASDLTRTGSLLGTAAYMAIEQVSSGATEIGPWSDVYAMGTILYEMLAGTPAYDGATLTEVLHRVLVADVVPLATVRPGLPAAIYDLVARCTSLDAAKRPQDAEAMRLLLAAAQLVPAATAIPPPKLTPANREQLGRAATEAVASLAGHDSSPAARDASPRALAATLPAAPGSASAAPANNDATALMRPARTSKSALAATTDATSPAKPTSSTSPGARPPRETLTPSSPPRIKWPLILGGVALAAATGVSVMQMLRTPPSPPNNSASIPSAAPSTAGANAAGANAAGTNAAPANTAGANAAGVGTAAPNTATASSPSTAAAAPNTAAPPNAAPPNAAAPNTAATLDRSAAPNTAATPDTSAAPNTVVAPTTSAVRCDAKALRDEARAANKARDFAKAIDLATQGLSCGGNETGLHAAIVFAACKLGDDKLVMKHHYTRARLRIEAARSICARYRALP